MDPRIMSIVIGDDPTQVLSPSEIVEALRLLTVHADMNGMNITADALQDAEDTAQDEIRRNATPSFETNVPHPATVSALLH